MSLKIIFEIIWLLLGLAQPLAAIYSPNFICLNEMCRCKKVFESSYMTCKFQPNASLDYRSHAPAEEFVTFDLLRNDDSNPAFIPRNLFANLTIDSLNMFNLNLRELDGWMFDGIESVSNLYLASNCITNVEFNKFPAGFSKDLVLLSLKNNLLEVVPNMNNLVKLTYIDLSFNRIKILDTNGLNKIEELFYLDLSNNLLGDTIDFSNVSDNLKTALREFRVNNNRIGQIVNLERLQKLNGLAIHSNNLCTIKNTTFSQSFNRNEELDLSYNKIDSIERNSFRNLTRLIHLDISFNKLTDFNESIANGLCNLKTLDLKFNYIEYLDFTFIKKLKSLESLDLSNNKIRQISFESLRPKLLKEPPMLSILVLSNNQLEDISFPKLINLEKLYLNGNYLKVHPILNELPRLDLVDVSDQNGRLKHIHTESAFNRMTSSLFVYNISANTNISLSNRVFCPIRNVCTAKQKSFQMDLYISNTTVLNMKPCVFKRFASIYDRVRLFILNDSVEKPTHDFSLVCDCKFRMYLSRFNVLIKDVCPRYGTYCEPMTYKELCKDNDDFYC